MSFQLSKCIGLTVSHPQQAAEFYESWLGISPLHTPEGLQLPGAGLTFFLDPDDRRPPLLELLTDDLESARTMLSHFGCREEVWYGPGKLNLISDPFGLHWNIYQQIPENPWPVIKSNLPSVPAKLTIQTHETEKAARFYADLLNEPAMETPSGWAIDSNGIRLIIEPGLPPGIVFTVDSDSPLVNAEITEEVFGGKHCSIDPFGTPWKLLSRPNEGKAVVVSSEP